MDTAWKLRLARCASVCLLTGRRLVGLGSDTVVRRNGIAWDLDLAEGIDLSIYLLGGFELSALRAYRKVVRPGGVVIDVGANIGAHALPLAELVGPGGIVVAVEPTAYAFAKLRENVRLNPNLASRIRLHQAMVVAEPDDAVAADLYSGWPLHREDGLHAAHGGKLHTTGGASAVTLDGLVESLGLPSVDLLKVDVDGNELPVLQGGVRTMARFRPQVMLELAPHVYRERADFDRLLRLLWDAGYDLTILGRTTPLPHDPEAVRMAIPRLGGANALATPMHATGG